MGFSSASKSSSARERVFGVATDRPGSPLEVGELKRIQQLSALRGAAAESLLSGSRA
jgi:hypothetical protein